MSKNTFPLILLIAILTLLVVLFASGKLSWQSNDTTPTDLTVQTNLPQPSTPGASTDSQSNQLSASPIPVAKTPVAENQPVTSIAQDKEDILQALVDKNGFDITAMQMTYSEITSTHAMGGVSPKYEEVGGGYWFAAKNSNGQWIIAADGNGTIECVDIEPYNFPISMIPECYNSATGKVVVR